MASDPDYIVESRHIVFGGEDETIVTFTKTHYHVPSVTVLAALEDVNVHLSNLTTTGVTLRTNAGFSGKIHMQAISKKS